MSFGDKVRTNIESIDDARKFAQQAGETLNNISATVSVDGMTADPETDTEAGFITVTINGTDYQIPIYAA